MTKRFCEPSTWAGLATLFNMGAVSVPGGALLAWPGLVCGAMAVILREGGRQCMSSRSRQWSGL